MNAEPESAVRQPGPSHQVRADLHTHSAASDGLYPPAALARLAHEAGLTVLALTDHDTTAGVAEAMAAGERLGLRVIPGVEINTDLPDGHGAAHVLGYFVEWEQPSFQHNLALLRQARERRAERMVERLRAAGLAIAWERVRALAQGTVGRPHLAQALIEGGYATSVADAFSRYLSPGAPGYVPRYKLLPDQAVQLIRGARGISALAHPAGIRDLEREVLPDLVMAGLQGLECYYGEYDAATVERLVGLAAGYGLIATGGSDYHGPGIHPTPLGARDVPASTIERLERGSAVSQRLPTPDFWLDPPQS